MARREECIALIDRIEAHDWINYKCCGFDRKEAAILLDLLKRWKKESDRHQKEYAENSDYYKKINSDRYYANKGSISKRRKHQYSASKLEVFKK